MNSNSCSSSSSFIYIWHLDQSCGFQVGALGAPTPKSGPCYWIGICSNTIHKTYLSRVRITNSILLRSVLEEPAEPPQGEAIDGVGRVVRKGCGGIPHQAEWFGHHAYHYSLYCRPVWGDNPAQDPLWRSWFHHAGALAGTGFAYAILTGSIRRPGVSTLFRRKENLYFTKRYCIESKDKNYLN